MSLGLFPMGHYAYRPAFQEEDICPTCTRYPDDVVAWPCPRARLWFLLARCTAVESATNVSDTPVLTVEEIRSIISDAEEH